MRPDTPGSPGAGLPDWSRLAALDPDWPDIPGVHGFVTGRRGGVSRGPWGAAGGHGGLNLGDQCGDAPADVRVNRGRLAEVLPAAPVWLRQVHGVHVHRVRTVPLADAAPPVADAAVTDVPGCVLGVLTADCLPVMLADRQGRAVGIAHAGWRGLSEGILEQTVAALAGLLPRGAALQAWLGPAIGQLAFEVGDEVRQAFCEHDPAAAAAFAAGRVPGKWQADLYQLARQRLSAAGVGSIAGGGGCTFTDSARFWSYRRSADCGRMASLIWFAR